MSVQQLCFDLSIPNDNYDWEDFMVDSSNRAAFNCVNNSPDSWLGYLAVIHGPSGCGKSFLLQLWAKRNAAIVVKNLVEVENIIAGGVQAITSVGGFGVRENAGCRCCCYAMDISSVQDVLENEELLFHFLNFVKNNNLKLLLVAPSSPKSWGIKTPDLLSRLQSGDVIEITQPSDDLLYTGLQKMFSDRQINVKPVVISYILKNVERSFSSIVSVVDRIDKDILGKKKNITIKNLKHIINEMDCGD